MSSEAPSPGGAQKARKAVHAVLWNYLSFGLGKLLVLVTTAILARLLTPSEFGVVALATLAVTYLDALKDLGLGPALIQRRADDLEEAANTVFTLNLILGGLLSLIGILVAPLFAEFFRNPLVTPLLRVLSLSFVLNALGSVHVIRLQRELEFRKKLIPDLARSSVKGIVSIGLALAGASVWALVIGQLAGVLVFVVAAWIVFPWRPKLTINGSIAGVLLKFGVTVIGVDILAVLTDNFDYLIIGRVFGEAPLGIYTLAYRLPELLVLNMLWVLAAAIFPAFASLQDEPETLRRGFLTTIRFIQLAVLPICLGLFIAADPLIRVAFGEQWLDAIPILRILAVFAFITSIGFNIGDIYKAVGRPDILVKLELLNLGLLIPTLITLARFGVAGIAVGHVIISGIHMTLRLIIAMRFVHVSLGEIAAQLIPSLLAGLGLTVLAVPALYLTASFSPLVQLVAVTIAGAAGYLSISWIVERNGILSLMRAVAMERAS